MTERTQPPTNSPQTLRTSFESVEDDSSTDYRLQLIEALLKIEREARKVVFKDLVTPHQDLQAALTELDETRAAASRAGF